MIADYRLYRRPATALEPLMRPSPIERATALLAQRRRRRLVLGAHRELVGDPGWDVLLLLFVAKGRDGGMSIDRLAGEIDAPPMVLARWVAALAAKGLTTPPSSVVDGKAAIHLTAAGSALLETYLEEV